ncbi:MAG TPA: vanadium-dependent haloperoxidase [Thermoanaerobaculia bacterium]|nr:vanadium-dependent haloperoxidase [Thermoanaerobaculia bacterium]
MSRRLLVAGLGLALLPGLAVGVRADVVIDWNNATLNAIRVDRTAPPRASRALALVHVSIFDAVNSVAGGPYTSYRVQPVEFVTAVSAEAAAAAAAHRVLIDLFPAQQAAFEAALAASLAAIPDGPAKSSGVSWGIGVAEQILVLRDADHSGDTVDYAPPLGGMWWTPTAASVPALLPNWPYVTPWAMTSGSQFRTGPPPPAAGSPEYTAAFREVRRLGRATSSQRTAEQTQIALFWADGAGTATPPGHWFLIAQGLSQERHLGLLENARLFALLGVAVADAAIVSWDYKYTYSFWRPATAIPHADLDGNPATVADPRWTPLIATPPFPSYTSGHSTFSGASSRVLALFFGTDQAAFSTTSDGLPGVQRSFTSFSQAAEEAGQSRIYGGIHWQFDNQVGLASGRALGDHVFYTLFGPVAAPGPCAASSTALCLGGRFKVEARWRTANGSGAAQGASLGADSGYFWFFDEDNTELTVKVLNACAEYDRYWVFASGLTDVEVLLTVTDTQTGNNRQYFNPQGKAFAPVQDVQAFTTCP